MTNEQKMEQIKSYIDDIITMEQNKDLSINEKQHLKRALQTYNEMFTDAERGKMDVDFLYENITSFLYMVQ